MRLRRGAARRALTERTKANEQTYGTVEERAQRVEAKLMTGPKTPKQISNLTGLPMSITGSALLHLEETRRARRVGHEWMLYP